MADHDLSRYRIIVSYVLTLHGRDVFLAKMYFFQNVLISGFGDVQFAVL